MPSEVESHDAIQMVRLLAEPERLRVAAALVLGHDRLRDIAAVTGVQERAVGRAIARFVSGGLFVQEQGGAYRFAVEELKVAARKLAVAADDDEDLEVGPAQPRCSEHSSREGS